MPEPVNTALRYIHPETAVVYWVPEIEDVNAPTRLELEHEDAVDLTREIADAPGWGVSANRVAVPDLGFRFTSRISGRIDPEDSQMVFYASEDTEDIRDVLSRGDRGHVVIMHGGDVVGQKMDVYPVQVVSLSKPLNVAGDPAQITVDFAVTGMPGEDVEIPADPSP